MNRSYVSVGLKTWRYIGEATNLVNNGERHQAASYQLEAKDTYSWSNPWRSRCSTTEGTDATIHRHNRSRPRLECDSSGRRKSLPNANICGSWPGCCHKLSVAAGSDHFRHLPKVKLSGTNPSAPEIYRTFGCWNLFPGRK